MKDLSDMIFKGLSKYMKILKHILSLNGPVVTAAGFNDELAIVTHVSDCLPSNEQMLEFTLFNISKGTQIFRGRLPLTPGSYLTWFGFSEEGQISSYDSKGVLRVSQANMVATGFLFLVPTKKGDLVLPKPVLTLINLSFPLASSDLGEEALENEFMLNNLHLSKIQKQIEATAGEGLDTTSLDDEAFDIEAAQDRCIFRIIASCCNSDKLVRAIELVKLLSVEKSVRGAIQLATAMKLPILVERFNEILEERLRNKIKDSNTGLSSSKHDLAVNKPYTATERLEPFAPSSSAKLSAPVFTKKVKPLERVKFGKQKTGIDQTANLEDSEEVKDAEKNDGSSHVNGVKEVKNSDSQCPLNLFPKLPDIRDGKKDPSNPVSKSSNEESKKDVGERPSNPFLKSTVK
ncbi:Transducin family protein / WD-40 repeat family protein isoform 2 [Hibiscus syriacus]|uniref:Transducin family protein / WD-40 repeat family protein isoform 2 n=1 Tax=Hibiscus syriacus TaxID=106335 RepID=A0A6A3CY56_HIBSY|nr:Transducin family protein / WD-40 repeat family protein isoform 2 [Hibiscus syriacus]